LRPPRCSGPCDASSRENRAGTTCFSPPRRRQRDLIPIAGCTSKLNGYEGGFLSLWVIGFARTREIFSTSLETKYLKERIKNYSKPKNNIHPSISTANYFPVAEAG
jgi:hypothetical protein